MTQARLIAILAALIAALCVCLALGAALLLSPLPSETQCPKCTCMCDENGAHLFIGDLDGDEN